MLNSEKVNTYEQWNFISVILTLKIVMGEGCLKMITRKHVKHYPSPPKETTGK